MAKRIFAAIVGIILSLMSVFTPAVAYAQSNVPPTLKYTALGDSITSAYGVTQQESWVKKYSDFVKSDLHTDVTTTNYGVFARTSTELLNSLQNDPNYVSSVQNADLITLEIGINDFLGAKAQYSYGVCGGSDNQDCFRTMVINFKSNWDSTLQAIDNINGQKSQYIVAGDLFYPFYSTDQQNGNFNTFLPYLNEMNAYIHTTAAQKNIPVTNIFVEFNGSNGQENPETKGYIMMPDGIHLTPTGHTAYANTVRTLGYAPLDADQDQVADVSDNCLGLANPTQENINSESFVLPYPLTSKDNTNIIGDNLGDACDPDRDHDGLTNTQEAALGTNQSVMDTDEDGQIDGIENRCGSNPLSAASTVKNPNGTVLADSDNDKIPNSCEALIGTNPNNSDTDGDSVLDSTEVLAKGSNPLTNDSDQDGCKDDIELASVTSDINVNVVDLSLVAQKANTTMGQTNYISDFDINGDKSVNVLDLAFIAARNGKNCNS